MNYLKKIDRSRRILQTAAKMSKQYYDKPLVIAYSGGKDSDVLLHLAVRFLNPKDFEVINSHTTADAPETVYHIREVLKTLSSKGYKTTIHYPEKSMWKLIPEKSMPPTRTVRYCCKVLKELSTPNRIVGTGVRKDESVQRSSRNDFEVVGRTKKERKDFTLEHTEEVYEEAQKHDEIWDCQLITSAKQNKKLVCNPIFRWTHNDIWDYIHENHIKYNPLYDKGYLRVGCIGCPMGGRNSMLKEFSDFPKIKDLYMRSFDRMIKARKAKGMPTKWKSADDVFKWWTNDPNIPGQMSFEEIMEE